MIGAHDLVVVTGVVLWVAVLGSAGAAVVLRLLRPRTMWASVAVVVATAAAVMAAGVLALGRLMLVSDEALGVLVLAVGVAALTAGLVAALLARRLARSSRALAAAARRVGDGAAPGLTEEPDTRELRELATALHSAAQRLEEARRRARSVEASRTELVAWVSHDLRSPVAAIGAMAEPLEDGVVVDPGTVAEYHARTRRESVRLARMIDDLFEPSGIHAGALRVRPRRTSVEELVDEVVHGAEAAAVGKGVRLVSHRPQGSAVVVADPDQLARAVRNLVDNAVRHTPAGGTVVVSASAGADEPVVIAVEDGCGGIPERERERLFDVGYRGEGARTPGEGVGAGLGLAIAQGIVAAHAGRIDVGDSPEGCRFTVTLPASTTTHPDEGADGPPEVPVPGARHPRGGETGLSAVRPG
ncbi:HAMP domain-containing sensor histidine kinase [Actinotalea sp. AC32]|nr:HAMP domain-containing sensor histidine kinase [Actinotalea sp. AC32]